MSFKTTGNIYNQSYETRLPFLEVRGDSKTEFVVSNASGSQIMTVDTITPMITMNSDLKVNGDITYNNVTIITTTDPQIGLANNNLTNNFDIGFFGERSDDGKTPIYTGLTRDRTSGIWYFYDDLATEPGTTVGSSTLASLRGNTTLFNRYFSGDGSESNPAFSFTSETASGLYRIGSSDIGFSLSGTKTLEITASTLNTMNILPLANTTYNLGSALLKYSNLYSTNTNTDNLIASTTVKTDRYDNNTNAMINWYCASGFGYTFNMSAASFNVNTSAGSTVNFGSGTNNLYINGSGKTSFGTNLNPSSRQVYVSGDLEVTGMTYSNVTGNVTGNCSGSAGSATTAVTVTQGNQPNITSLPLLAVVQGTSVGSSAWAYLANMNQNVATTSNVSFQTITPRTNATYDLGSSSFIWNNIYANNLFGTIAASAGSQTNILEVGSLTRVGAITGYTSTIWQYVRDMQDVKTTATPTFSTLTLQPASPTSANRLTIRSGASGNFASLSVGRTADDSLFAIASGTTGASSGNYFTGSLGGDLCIRSENTGNIMMGFSSTAVPVLTLAYAGNIIMTNGAVQVSNTVKAQTYRGGVVAEDSTNIINIGINEDSAARFGGTYVQASQGGMLRVDTRTGQPLFSFLTRAAGSASAVSSVLNIPATVSTTTGTTLGVDGSNNLIRISSSARYKKNIVESKIDSSKVFDLDIREFDYKDTDVHDVGLIAEEVEEVLPELVIYGKDSEGADRPDSVKYDRLALLLLEEVKKLRDVIIGQNTIIEALNVRLLAVEALQ
jgi:hypothetical protein